jgi:hypothetical protein
MSRNLEQTLQALNDSEINVTITMLWDGGVDFAFVSYLDFNGVGLEPGEWHNVKTFAELSEALHRRALAEYPTSGYAKQFRNAS